MKSTILILATLLTFDVCGFQLLGVESGSAWAQEYYTPAPPRPRRAYSTVDTYNYAHGVTDSSTEKSKRSHKAKKKKVTPTKIKNDSNTGSESSLTKTYSSTTTSNTGSRTTSSTTSNTASGTNTSSSTSSSTSATATTGDAVDPGGVETLIGISKDKPKKSALTFTAPDPKTLVLNSSELSSIPSQPQMPVPPTSMGGL